MLFYNFNTLDAFIKDNLIINLTKEAENLKELEKLYQNKKSNLLSFTTNILENTDSNDKDKLEAFHGTISCFKTCFERLDDILIFLTKLQDLLQATIALYDKGLTYYEEEIKANLVEYNKQRDDLSNKILEIENLYSSLPFSFQDTKKKKTKQNMEFDFSKEQKRIDIEAEPYDHNCLIISEKDQKAYLPFFYSEVKSIYEKSAYQTLQDVINNCYVLPLSQFKNSSISRFKQAFHLMRNKEHSSIAKALDLALELMFQYNLNPIVIAACRNIDELDIYLDCLAENELYDFTCFEIKFECMPKLVKNKKDTF